MHSYPRIAPPPEMPPPLGLDGMTLDLLRQMVETALVREPEKHEPHHVIRPHKITVREKVAEIRDLLALEGRVSFRAVIEGCQSRMEIIVSFLAVLELIKSRVLDALQDATFADIVLVPVDDAPLEAAPLEPAAVAAQAGA
jgi:segregation and condensation protein A